MGLPPSVLGALHVMRMELSAPVELTFRGAEGIASGVAETRVESGPDTEPTVARTATCEAVPLVSPVIVQVVEEVRQVPWVVPPLAAE